MDIFKVFDFDSKCSLWRFRCPVSELSDLLASDDPAENSSGDQTVYERMKYSPEFTVGGTKFRLHLQLRRLLNSYVSSQNQPQQQNEDADDMNAASTLTAVEQQFSSAMAAADQLRGQIRLGVHLQCLTYDLRGVFAHYRIVLNNHSIREEMPTSASKERQENSGNEEKETEDPLMFQKVSRTFHCHFKKYGSAWGTQNFVPMEDVMGPANGYVDHSLHGVDSMPCEFDHALHTLSRINANYDQAMVNSNSDGSDKKLQLELTQRYGDSHRSDNGDVGAGGAAISSSILKKVMYFPATVSEEPCVVFDLVLRVLEPDQKFIYNTTSEVTTRTTERTTSALGGRLAPLPNPSTWAEETLEKLQLNKMYKTFYDQFDSTFDAASDAIQALKVTGLSNHQNTDGSKDVSGHDQVIPAVVVPQQQQQQQPEEWDETWSTPPPFDNKHRKLPVPQPGCSRLLFPYEDVLCDMRIALGSVKPLLQEEPIEAEGDALAEHPGVTDDTSVLCHRAVITSRVPQLIPEDMLVVQPGAVIYIADVSDMAVLYCFLEYIYTEDLSLVGSSGHDKNTTQINLSPVQIIDLYCLSKQYQLPHLGDECLTQLVPRLDGGNILNVIASRFLPEDEALNVLYLRVLLSAYDHLIVDDAFSALPGQLNRRLSLLLRGREPIPPLRRSIEFHPNPETRAQVSQLSLLASTGLYSDYELSVGSIFSPHKIRTHRVILASRSEAFFDAFHRRPAQLIAVHRQQEERKRLAHRHTVHQQHADNFGIILTQDASLQDKFPRYGSPQQQHQRNDGLIDDISPTFPHTTAGSGEFDLDLDRMMVEHQQQQGDSEEHGNAIFVSPIPELIGPDFDFPIAVWQKFLGALYRGSFHKLQPKNNSQGGFDTPSSVATTAAMTPEDIALTWKLTDVLRLDGKLRQESLGYINTATALNVLIFAEKHNCDGLKDVALSYVAKDLTVSLQVSAREDPPNAVLIADLSKARRSMGKTKAENNGDIFDGEPKQDKIEDDENQKSVDALSCTWGTIAALPYPALMKLFKTVMDVAVVEGEKGGLRH